MLNIMKAVCVIIGTVIGAGFASGREIYLFFNTYGEKGILGIIIASIITGVIIYKVLKQNREKKVQNYNQYIENLGINKKVKEVLSSIINIFLLVSFYIMVAGFCAYFQQEFDMSPVITGSIMAGLCYFTFLNKIEGVTKINAILIPVLIGMIFLIGIKNGFGGIESFRQSAQMQQIEDGWGWIVSSIEYASYNSILLVPILIGLKKYSFKKEKVISIVSAVIFFLLSFILYIVILKGGRYIQDVELPLIYIVKQFGSIYQYFCGGIVISAIFTTAISAGYGFLQNITKTKKTYNIMALAICITSIFVSKIGFSFLVNLLYPVFGFLSFIQLVYILRKK